jgi:predicted molibdopterin-dependent oxidoreductase YjgC
MPAEPLPRADARLLRIEIDHRAVSVPQGTTVMRAAELAGVPVPKLCSHKELSPFGGCRMCTVEIDGVPGFPLACSTLAQDKMKVITDTAVLREMHREVLELILSQHPSSCLLCDETEECERNQRTIRKAGVSTGCRSCPNDGDCELQRVVEQVGISAIGHPIAYRGLEPEHDEPFFDRDYNLCILCGRCVRMCHEVRGASVLSFKHRGPRTMIGPAFGASHLEAGCEFCGSCVSVCPTGTLAEKVSKWDGKPDGLEPSTCPFCALGCQIELAHKDGALSSARAAQDTEINDGQVCVRGRFCLPETTHHYSRARKPMLRRGAYFRVATWDEALDAVGKRLAEVAPDEFLMLVSSDLTNEGLYAARRFVHAGLGSDGIDSTARERLPGGPAAWARLLSLPVSLKAVGEADAVVVAGLDARFSFSVAGVQVRRAVRRGARLTVVDARDSGLARAADDWIRPRPGDEARALGELLRRAENGRMVAIVIGPRVFDCPGAEPLVAALEELAARESATIVPLAHGANVRGALELGVLSGSRAAARRPKVLYLVGEAPSATRPDCDVVIAQDLYLPPFEVDAFLPAASFAEAAGTLTNIEGRVQELRSVEHLPPGAVHGFALPDWRIFSELAGRLGRRDLRYEDDGAVRAAIRAEVPGFPAEHDRSPRRMTPATAAQTKAEVDGESLAGAGRFILVPERAAFRHRGIDLADVVEGLGELHLEEGLRMCPDDLERLGVGAGGVVTVRTDGSDHVIAARPDPDCPRGAAYVTWREAWGASTRPLRVRISAGDQARSSRRVAAIPGGG